MMGRALLVALGALLVLAGPADAALCGYDAGAKRVSVAITPGTVSTV